MTLNKTSSENGEKKEFTIPGQKMECLLTDDSKKNR